MILNLLILALCFFLVLPVNATQLRVGPGQHFSSIQAAVDFANSGDEILVKSGKYPERVIVNKSNITIVSEQLHMAHLTGLPNASNHFGVGKGRTRVGFAASSYRDRERNCGITNVTLKGFRISNDQHYALEGNPAHPDTRDDSPVIKAGCGWTIDQIWIHDVGWGIDAPGDDITVTDAIIENIKAYNAHAITAENPHFDVPPIENLRFERITLRNVNFDGQNTNVAWSGVVKILGANRVVVKQLYSESNVGYGWWHDFSLRYQRFGFSVIRNIQRSNQGFGYGVEIEGTPPRGEFGIFPNDTPVDNTIICQTLMENNESSDVFFAESSGAIISGNAFLSDSSIGTRDCCNRLPSGNIHASRQTNVFGGSIENEGVKVLTRTNHTLGATPSACMQLVAFPNRTIDETVEMRFHKNFHQGEFCAGAFCGIAYNGPAKYVRRPVNVTFRTSHGSQGVTGQNFFGDR